MSDIFFYKVLHIGLNENVKEEHLPEVEEVTHFCSFITIGLRPRHPFAFYNRFTCIIAPKRHIRRTHVHKLTHRGADRHCSLSPQSTTLGGVRTADTCCRYRANMLTDLWLILSRVTPPPATNNRCVIRGGHCWAIGQKKQTSDKGWRGTIVDSR